MGFIRGVGLVVICILLFLSLLLTGVFATLSLSLDYENVKVQTSETIKEIVNEKYDQKIIDNYENISKNYCANNSEYVFKDVKTNRTFLIPCEVILEGPDAIIENQVETFAQEKYYKEYDCKFLNCFESEPAEEWPSLLISKQAKNYWKSMYFTFLLISIILGILIFFLVENKTNFQIISGIILGVSFFIISMLNNIGESIINLISPFISGLTKNVSSLEISSTLSVFFNKADIVFFIGLIIAIVLFLTGIIIKLFYIGFEIKEFFSKPTNKNKKDTKSDLKNK